MKLPIQNRSAAGKALAAELVAYQQHPNAIVLALPRGGVPVAFEIAQALGLPLDLMIVRKLGVPWHRELAMGAIASGGVQVMNTDVVRYSTIDERDIAAVLKEEQAELLRRERAYRGERPWPSLRDRHVILVDDGIATGATMRAAIDAVRVQHPAGIIVATPLAPAETLMELKNKADRVVCLATPEPFNAIGQWYVQFDQTSDSEVKTLLTRASTTHKE